MSTKNQRFCCFRPVNTGADISFDGGENCDLDNVWDIIGPTSADTGTGTSPRQPFVPTDSNIPEIWMPNSESDCSRWITPDCNLIEGALDDEEDTERTYEVQWDIPVDPRGMVLCVRFAVDNLLLRVTLNGDLITGERCNDANFIFDPPGTCKDKVPGFKQFHVFEIHQRTRDPDLTGTGTAANKPQFICGINTLKFVTQNHKGTCAKPFASGFRAEFFCRCGCPCESPDPPCLGLANTGEVCLESDVIGTSDFPPGTGTCCIDGAWDGEANFFGPSTQTNPWPELWVDAPSPLGGPSLWLHPVCDADKSVPEREYEYTTNFEMNQEPETVKILVYWAADNQLISFVLNGTDLGIEWLPIPCSVGTGSFRNDLCINDWCFFVILGTDGALKKGSNTLVATIKNVKGDCDEPFAAGFRLEWVCVSTRDTGTGTSTEGL